MFEYDFIGLDVNMSFNIFNFDHPLMSSFFFFINYQIHLRAVGSIQTLEWAWHCKGTPMVTMVLPKQKGHFLTTEGQLFVYSKVLVARAPPCSYGMISSQVAENGSVIFVRFSNTYRCTKI